MRLKSKVALITGGSLGLGKATAHLFAEEGANVVITGRTEKTLVEKVGKAKQAGHEISHIVSDVSKESDCREAVDLQIAHLVLIVLALLTINFMAYRWYRYCRLRSKKVRPD